MHPFRTPLIAATCGAALVGLAGTAGAQTSPSPDTDLYFGEPDATIDFNLTTGSLSGANYFNDDADTGGASPLDATTPATKTLFLGNGATITHGPADPAVSVVSIRAGIAAAANQGPTVGTTAIAYPRALTALNVTGGTVTTTGVGGSSLVVGDGNNSTVSVTGGSLTVGGGAQVGSGGPLSAAGSVATLNVSGTGVVTTANGLLAGNSPQTTGVVNLGPGGTLTVGDGVGADDVRVGSGGAPNSRVNVTGGTLTANSLFFVGGSGTSTGNAVNQSAGTVTVPNADAASGDSLLIGGPPTSDGTYNLSGGSLTTGGGVVVGNNGAGTLDVSGDATATFGGNLALAALATGTGALNVTGGAATLSVTGNLVSGGANAAGASVNFVSGDDVSTVSVTGTVTLADGSTLSLDIGADASPDAAYDLITGGSVALGAVNFAGPAGYTLQVISGGNGQILQAVAAAVPEPAAAAGLLGLGALALQRRTRRHG